jgi:hypothetical protein
MLNQKPSPRALQPWPSKRHADPFEELKDNKKETRLTNPPSRPSPKSRPRSELSLLNKPCDDDEAGSAEAEAEARGSAPLSSERDRRNRGIFIHQRYVRVSCEIQTFLFLTD